MRTKALSAGFSGPREKVKRAILDTNRLTKLLHLPISKSSGSSKPELGSQALRLVVDEDREVVFKWFNAALAEARANENVKMAEVLDPLEKSARPCPPSCESPAGCERPLLTPSLGGARRYRGPKAQRGRTVWQRLSEV